MSTEELLDQIDWYRRCLEDVQDRKPVRGLAEAKLGYDRAMELLRMRPAEPPESARRAYGSPDLGEAA